MAYDVARRKTDVLISHPTLSIHNAEVSLDQQWISFVTPIGNESPLYIAPMRDGQAVPEPEWIRIADKGNNRRPWWSPNGRVLYFTSERDGFRCFRAQRLDPVSKRPLGEPIDVKHFHEKRLTGDFGPAILTDQFIVALQDESTNVWLADFKE